MQLTLIDAPGPFAPLKELRDFIAEYSDSPILQEPQSSLPETLELVRGFLAHRLAHPFPGDNEDC